MELCEKLNYWMVSVEIKALKKMEKEEEEEEEAVTDSVRHPSLTTMKQLLYDRKQLKKPKRLKK